MTRGKVFLSGFACAVLSAACFPVFCQEKPEETEKPPVRRRLVRVAVAEDSKTDSKPAAKESSKAKKPVEVSDNPNLVVKLSYYKGKKVTKEIFLVTCSNRFATTQEVDGKSLVFTGEVSMRFVSAGRYYFILKYSIRMDGVDSRSTGIAAETGMAGLKPSAEKIKIYSACNGSVKLLDGRPVVVYILSNLLPNSKTKLDPETSFEVSVSKWKPKRK